MQLEESGPTFQGIVKVNIEINEYRQSHNAATTKINKYSSSSLFTVNRCGPFDIVERSGIVAFNNSVGGLVVVKCDKSSSFPQGLRDNSFRCLPDLTWERHGFCIGEIPIAVEYNLKFELH